jgi:hypothetical protein
MALNLEEGATNQGIKTIFGRWEKQENGFSSQVLGRNLFLLPF